MLGRWLAFPCSPLFAATRAKSWTRIHGTGPGSAHAVQSVGNGPLHRVSMLFSRGTREVLGGGGGSSSSDKESATVHPSPLSGADHAGARCHQAGPGLASCTSTSRPSREAQHPKGPGLSVSCLAPRRRSTRRETAAGICRQVNGRLAASSRLVAHSFYLDLSADRASRITTWEVPYFHHYRPSLL